MSSVGPMEHRDFRSQSHDVKRTKDHSSKWSNGMRASPGVKGRWVDNEGIHFETGSDEQARKCRPEKQLSHTKASKGPKSVNVQFVQERNLSSLGRHTRKADTEAKADFDTSTSLSKSLLELLPQHINNNFNSVRTARKNKYSSEDSAISGILYSFDTKRASPTENGRAVDLGGLVEQAEQKWKSKETDKLVGNEYEVLDNEGETTILTTKKGKKGSPKQKIAVVEDTPVEDDGFELI